MGFFDCTDYKAILKHVLNERQEEGRRVNLTKLSLACGVQKTYLSKVLNHDSHLSSDQLHLACKYLGFKQVEIKYVFLLHEAERSGLAERKELLQREARKLQAKSLSTENYISAETVAPDEKEVLKFHLDPIIQLVHIFLSIPHYAKNPKLIAEELHLEKDQLEKCLDDLVKARFICREGQGWKVLRESVHLSKDSDVYVPYRLLLRIMSFEKLRRSQEEGDYSFSVLFSADEATRRMIQQKFMEFLKNIEPLVKKAKAQNVYQLNFDLLSWSKNKTIER